MKKYFKIKLNILLIDRYIKLSDKYLQVAALQSGYNKDKSIRNSAQCLSLAKEILEEIND